MLPLFNAGRVNFAWDLPEVMHHGIQIPPRLTEQMQQQQILRKDRESELK